MNAQRTTDPVAPGKFTPGGERVAEAALGKGFKTIAVVDVADVANYAAAVIASLGGSPGEPVNQCDGCARKLPIRNGIHYELDTGHTVMVCSAYRYKESSK